MSCVFKLCCVLQDLLAVGYGQFEFTGQKGGLICCWSLKNPEVSRICASCDSTSAVCVFLLWRLCCGHFQCRARVFQKKGTVRVLLVPATRVCFHATRLFSVPVATCIFSTRSACVFSVPSRVYFQYPERVCIFSTRSACTRRSSE